MYEELVKRLRHNAINADSGNEIGEAFYADIMQAADAIEELSRKYTEERNAAVELTGELANKHRWISVEERLPETGQDVLVKFPQNMAVASRDMGEWVVNSGDGWCTGICLSADEKEPTHWMPLPEPPKEERAECS